MTDQEARDEREELEDWSFEHRPILSMRDGSIASCKCLDRVFVNGQEDWDSHVADSLLAAGYRKHPEPAAGDLTDAEWREFQAIPEQGYSHRHWVDHKIRQRVAAEAAKHPEPEACVHIDDPDHDAYARRRAENELYAARQKIAAFEHVFAAFDELRRTGYVPMGYTPQWRERAERAEAALAVPVDSPEPMGEEQR